MDDISAAKFASGQRGLCTRFHLRKICVYAFLATERLWSSRPEHLLKQIVGEGPLGPGKRGSSATVEARHARSLVEMRLRTVHPNPGPGRRRGRRGGRTEEEKKVRNERRKMRRRARRGPRANEGARGNGGDEDLTVVTWNLQGMSMREQYRRKLREVIGCMERRRWEVLLMSEIRAEEEGVVWLGANENLTAVVHSRRTGIILRGRTLDKWIEEGQNKWFEPRATTVTVGEFRLVAVYQPLWQQGAEEIEEYRHQVENQVSISGTDEMLIIGGDHNAHVGGDSERAQVAGRWGVRYTSEAGRNLLNWCEEHGMAYANSFFRHRSRGTWFSNIHRRWYELDGFLVKKHHRHSRVRNVSTVEITSLSDHKPKKMRVRRCRKKWRTGGARRRVPQIRWERLRSEETRRRYEDETRRRMERAVEEGMVREEGTNWDTLTEVLVGSAREVCGERERRVENPWMAGREEEVEGMRRDIQETLRERTELHTRRRTRAVEQRLAGVRRRLKAARDRLKRSTRAWEREWWSGRIRECQEAQNRGDIGEMYKILREIGKGTYTKSQAATTVTTAEFREQFSEVSKERYEVEPAELREVVERVEDMSGTARAREANDLMNEVPQEEEVLREMRRVKDSAPGEDGVRMVYINSACPEVKAEVVRMVRSMFENRAERWEESLKTGQVVPIHKKGSRNDRNNYRGVCLLAMASRILARVLASRLRWWAEWMGLLDDNQAGFRQGRSTADATQVMVRMEEDVMDYRRRRVRFPDRAEEREEVMPAARLLDLTKAYPRVSRPALWGILRRYGLAGPLMDTVMDMHETATYKVKGKEGSSEPWHPERGLREGCPTSPVLFNVFHQAVMRQATTARREAAEAAGEQVGVEWHWLPGSGFPGQNLWEKYNSESKPVRLDTLLFADDTTILGEEAELREGVEVVKRVMGRFEERNNEEKEEEHRFGREECGGTRMLGSWLGPREDLRNRIKRANGLWYRVRAQLKNTRLSKRMQARIVEACVESGLLFDCAVRTWWVADTKRLQSWIDRCYRYIWSNHREPPLRQMQREGTNMQDVRNMLGVRSVRWKVEKRVLERIGHVLRMEEGRITKAAVFGWYGELEEWRKVPGRKRKTVLYWRRLVREAGWDVLDVERRASDRDEWREMVRERMLHLERWEKQKGHRYELEEGEERVECRNGGTVEGEEREGEEEEDEEENPLRCKHEGCDKVWKSRGGLAIHIKRMHKESREEVRFKCDKCGVEMRTEANLKNHIKICGGSQAEV